MPTFIKTLCLFFLGFLYALPAHAHSGIHDRIEDADRRITERPTDPAPYIHRAHLLAEHGQWQKAIADLDRAAASNRFSPIWAPDCRNDLIGHAIELKRTAGVLPAANKRGFVMKFCSSQKV